MMQAIPVLFPTPHGHNNGSGFQVRSGGRHWLTTAAHLAHLIRQPHKDWLAWPQVIMTPGGEIPLFDKLAPRFAYLDAGSTIADLLMLPLSRPLAGYDEFEIAGSAATVGERVTAFGYARMGSTLSRQQAAPGVIWGHRGELVLTTAAPPQGFSGGPLVTEAGRLVGMNIGTEEGVGVAVGLSPMARAIAGFKVL